MFALPRRLNLVLLTSIAALWAGVMVFGGLWLLLTGAGSVLGSGVGAIPVPTPVVQALGISAFAGGHFIFMALVADRLFPKASRAVVMPLEVGAFVVFAGALARLGMLLVSSGGQA